MPEESVDISHILEAWPFDPENCARIVDGKMYYRMELGILELELDGRPDGSTPYGFTFAVDYWNERIEGELEGEMESAEKRDLARDLQQEVTQLANRTAGYEMLSADDYLDNILDDLERIETCLGMLKEYAGLDSYLILEDNLPPFLYSLGYCRSVEAARRNDFDAALDHVESTLTTLRQFGALNPLGMDEDWMDVIDNLELYRDEILLPKSKGWGREAAD